MNTNNRALVVLAAYDYEALALTLQTLEHTLSPEELVVVVINGKRHSIAGEKTERVAREWAARNPKHRFAVRPLSCGKAAYHGLTEIMANYEPLRNVQFICKIDDDIIALRKGWMDRLANAYAQQAQTQKVGFVTGLINNNCWGFTELVDIFGKKEEYTHIHNYTSLAGDFGERKVAPGVIDTGMGGTVWNYPYLAWWIHQWTTLKPEDFIARTEGLGLKQIDRLTHYSIGCVFFEKKFWLDMDADYYGSDFDELLMHRTCRDKNFTKWALMDEPMAHLFYRTQRHANAAMLPALKEVMAGFYNDASFRNISPITHEDMMPLLEEILVEARPRISYLFNKVAKLSWGRRWKEKQAKKKLLRTA